MIAAVKAPPPSTVPTLAWQHDAAGWTLNLGGDWRAAKTLAAPAISDPPSLAEGATVTVDASRLLAWDAGTAPALWALLAPLRRRRVSLVLDSLPEGVQAALDLALPAENAPPDDVPAGPPPAHPVTRWLREWWQDARTTLGFLGEVLLALGRLARGRAVMRGSDLARQVDQTGPSSLPIVLLTCFLIGLMLAYMGGAQLARIGAPSFIADVVTVGVVRELAGLMTGVILAGRVGAAFAAQLGTMKANEEIDALRTLGIDPVEYLVLPRLLGMLLVAPLLIACAALVGVLAGLPPAVGLYGVPATEYLHKCVEALTWTHLWIGLFKGTLYVTLVALAGCREGLHAGRNAQAVGAATTTAVVKGLLWIVIAASGTTVVFQSLGL
jgi:phospholipid/cholesterol/gamma-HCH transport system permease protein